jgi:hypothetical protein
MTIAMNLKEIMNNMPDDLNTKKDVDSYYKTAMAKAIEINKKDNDAKPKKELNEYQKFMKVNITLLKEKNPQLTGPQVFSTIATMWKEHKASGITGVPEEAKDAVVAPVAVVAQVTDDKAVVAPVAPEAPEAVVADDKAVVAPEAPEAVAKKKKTK